MQARSAAAYRRLLITSRRTREGGDGIGIGQQPGGTDCYAAIRPPPAWILPRTTYTIGVAEVERIIHDELGVTRMEAGYRRRSTAEPGMYACSPAELERLFQGHIERLSHLPRYFTRVPATPFRLRPLDGSLSGLTYGF